jgi:hypothetical protein
MGLDYSRLDLMARFLSIGQFKNIPYIEDRKSSRCFQPLDLTVVSKCHQTIDIFHKNLTVKLFSHSILLYFLIKIGTADL